MNHLTGHDCQADIDAAEVMRGEFHWIGDEAGEVRRLPNHQLSSMALVADDCRLGCIPLERLEGTQRLVCLSRVIVVAFPGMTQLCVGHDFAGVEAGDRPVRTQRHWRSVSTQSSNRPPQIEPSLPDPP